MPPLQPPSRALPSLQEGGPAAAAPFPRGLISVCCCLACSSAILAGCLISKVCQQLLPTVDVTATAPGFSGTSMLLATWTPGGRRDPTMAAGSYEQPMTIYTALLARCGHMIVDVPSASISSNYLNCPALSSRPARPYLNAGWQLHCSVQ